MTIEPELEAKLGSLRGLPSPPRIAMHLIEAARDPDINLGKVAEIVTADPVITAKIMRVANSAIYSVRGGCDTLRRALLILGLDATLIIALSFSLALSLRRDKPRSLDHRYFWRRSLLAATAAASLAKSLHRPDGETVFLAALLQDIGMLALDKCEPDLYLAAGEKLWNHARLSDYEIETLGCDHADVSRWLLDRWGLPAILVESAASSHDPCRSGGDEFAGCVALSGPLADVWLASDWALSFRDLVTMAVECLHLDDRQLGIVLDDLRGRIPETEAMFEMDLIDPVAGFAALEEARELIVERGLACTASHARGLPQTRPVTPTSLLHLQHRAELDAVLRREFHNAIDSGSAGSIVLACIEGLDQVRERLGIEAADRLQRETARVMLSDSGAAVIGQMNEREIAVWLENCNRDGVRLAGRRMLRRFSEMVDRLAAEDCVKPSLSLRAASMDEAQQFDDFESMLRSARPYPGDSAESDNTHCVPKSG